MNPKKPPVFVFLGRGGAGKTETGPLVSKLTGLPVIELGQYIREQAKKKDPVAENVVSNWMAKGVYFPAEYSFQFMEKAIAENPQRFQNGFIIDGFPRKKEDLEKFRQFVDARGFRVGGLLEFKIPIWVADRRQKQREGRPETKEAVQSRHQEFKNNEQKVIDAFKKAGLVRTIGMQLAGRKRKLGQSRIPLELFNPNFLKRKARLVAKSVTKLRKRK
ncbi:MAG: nucleoside monophosphate kinase [Candidatus Micrarchaeota archaeon]